MSTLVIDMPSGVAGDMLLAALLAAGGDRTDLERQLAGLGCGPLPIAAETVKRGGIVATLVDVQVPQQAEWSLGTDEHTHGHDHGHTHDHDHRHAHKHRPYRVIRELLNDADLPERVRDRAQVVFRLLAEAEAAAHGVAVDDVHFHEVGSLDAIVDVVGCCLLLEQLAVDRIVCGPLTLGQGTVRCAHGRMPVPVPAVVHMLGASGAPHRRLDWDTGELTTPTGCALICALADSFTMPNNATELGRLIAHGYGAGHKDIDGLVNLIRVSCYAPADPTPTADRIVEARCLIDDASGEDIAVLIDDLLEAGALDAYSLPAVGKKGRPAHELTMLCVPGEGRRLSEHLLERGSSIGLRWQELDRVLLPRRQDKISMAGGTVRVKVVTLPSGRERAKPELDDLKQLAVSSGMPVGDLRQQALQVWSAAQNAS